MVLMILRLHIKWNNKEIIKDYIIENSKIGFIPTTSELENDRWYIEKDREDLSKMKFNVINIDISKESKEKYTKLADEIEKEYKDYKFIKLSNEQAIVVDNMPRDCYIKSGNLFYINFCK